VVRKNLSDSRDEKRAKLESLKVKIEIIEANSVTHFGKLAVRAGLADLNLKDATLLQEFAAIAARFRNGPQIPARQGARAPLPGGPVEKAA
jgi:hypothetical protein